VCSVNVCCCGTEKTQSQIVRRNYADVVAGHERKPKVPVK
jgi:hypothetical protein